MKSFQVNRLIPASPAAIWSVLTDARRLADGSFGILRIDGAIAAGAAIKLWSEADPKRAFALRVTAFDAPRNMVWEGGMPLGLFTGRRTFALEPKPQGTAFDMRETYSGPLAGLFTRIIPDLQPLFEKFADGLARAAKGQDA